MDFSVSMSTKPREHLPLESRLFCCLLVCIAKKQAEILSECFFQISSFFSVFPACLLYLSNAMFYQHVGNEIPTTDITGCKQL